MRNVVFIATLVSWGLAGCGGSTAASELAKAPEFNPKGQTKCSIAASQARPLIVEWPSTDRGDLEAAAKKGVNLSALFHIVHGANMAKRDPATGQFLKREDGKIIKPAGWQPPDVKAEIVRQLADGAWVRDLENASSASSTPVKH